MSSQPPQTSQIPLPPAHGFGSFATERDEDRIDVLIALDDDKYTPPQIPINIDLSQYPLPLSPYNESQNINIDPTIKPIKFGNQTMKEWYHIDPEWTFLNHGAFGATFKPVSDAEGLWHRYMESQPLRFIDRKLLPLLVYTTRRLAKFIHVPATDLIILPNVTNGLNTVLNSIDWYQSPSSPSSPSSSPPPQILTSSEPQIYSTLPLEDQKQGKILASPIISSTSPPLTVSDPIITTTTTTCTSTSITKTTTTTTTTIITLPTYVITFDTGYGATKQMIKSVQDKFGNHIIHQDLHLTFPISSPKEITQLLRNSLRKHYNKGTIDQVKLVIVDYVQSNSALIFPIEDLCSLCHQYNIPIMIDGAHSLGSFDLNIDKMKAKPTFFLANAHKWLCSGKGVSLLYVNPDKYPHNLIKPAVVSHGYSSQTLAGKFLWVGLQDYSHYLALNTAIDCWNHIGITTIRTYIQRITIQAYNYLVNQWNTDLLGSETMFFSMFCIRLPGPRVPKNGQEHTDLQDALYFKYKIEAPIKMLQNRLYIRVSCHIYNDLDDIKKLSNAMLELRPKLIGEEDQKDIEYADNAEAVIPFTSCG